MSLSKQPRELKCSRCRHHGIIVPQKGHTKSCPFLSCDCWKCYLITQRSRIAALQRTLKKAQTEIQSKEQPAAEGPDGAARQLAASGLRRPAPSGGGGGGRSAAWCLPLDLRSRPAAGGASKAGYDTGKVEEATWTAYNDVAPLPVIHLMSAHCPSGCVPCPHFMPPRPAGDLCGPRLVPHFQSAALHYPPAPQPGPRAECRHVFFSLQPPPLPDAFQREVELKSKQPQLPMCKRTGKDIVELD
ncbi:hypothetical protein D5F01_LYC19953 [Larimichthys crocea]|uniref:Uncharacterized protein n=1 Tax=Larimichthys crocea TaxID=215358 RepID=A0A0F8AR39_LARCR|nr:doublesex- and mab-3-related transcription factor B1 [Larimichthys crocea]KAE8282543.1 hypothetical protein D5F01_LYC19953 [Larimichthys crocea]